MNLNVLTGMRSLRVPLTVLAAAVLSACSALQVPEKPSGEVAFTRTGVDPFVPYEAPEDSEPNVAGRTLFEQKGSGSFFATEPEVVSVTPTSDAVNISFEDAPLSDVLKVMLGDLLQVPYSLEAGVEGTITLVSTSPVPRDVLMDMLESALEDRGLAMVRSTNGIYRIGTATTLRREVPVTSSGESSTQGYSVRIVPLKHLSVLEAQKILEPLGMGDSVLRVDPLRNIMMVGAAGPQMQNILRTLRMMDIDVLKGMSLGVYEVVNLDAVTLVERLNEVFTNPELEQLAMTAKLVALEEVNSIMVVAPNAGRLATIHDWLKRLDAIGLDDDQAGTQLYVYSVQNGEAAQIAGLLGQIFGDGASASSSIPRTSGTTAPGLAQSNLSSDGESAGARNAVSAGNVSSTTTTNGARIVADEVNNSLLVMASAKEWRTIRSALDRLDKAPAQVLVEVSIWEVTLTDELSFGVDWFFNTHSGVDGVMGGGRLTLQDGGAVGRTAPGFSYIFTGSDWRAVINTLASRSNVKSLSSPSILVLDNREASIQVGRQQPFRSSETVNTNNTGLVTQNVELKDTGVMLKVKPRVNAGGLVVMEIQQEVTDVGELDQATGQRSFLKRNVESSVAIQSGDTIILGGLIQDNNTSSDGGIPYLSRIPVLGYLFGTSSQGSSRTELLVTISPRAVNRYKDFDRIGEEFRGKMQGVAEAFHEQFEATSRERSLPVSPDTPQ